MFDDVERTRGRRPPVFADVRRSRSVRATGFRGATFATVTAKGRYHWFPGLGNERIVTRSGAVRLSRPADVETLLELIIAEHERGRRVVIFCSCASPWDAAYCHRQLVGEKLLAAARARRLDLWLEEWPGGTLAKGSCLSMRVVPGTFAALYAGGRWVTLGRRPKPEALGLPTGSIVTLAEGSETRLASVCPPRLAAKSWKLELFALAGARPSLGALHAEAVRKRAVGFLEPHRF